jgi:hypothetical protein
VDEIPRGSINSAAVVVEISRQAPQPGIYRTNIFHLRLHSLALENILYGLGIETSFLVILFCYHNFRGIKFIANIARRDTSLCPKA